MGDEQLIDNEDHHVEFGLTIDMSGLFFLFLSTMYSFLSR
jgi:hypothetical protein